MRISKKRLLVGFLGLAGLLITPPRSAAQSLVNALDAPGLVWIATNDIGGGLWAGTSATTHDGVDAARSGTPPLYGYAWLQTQLTNSGTLTFWAKADLPGGSRMTALLGGVGYFIVNPEWRAYHYEAPTGTNWFYFVFRNQDTTGVAGDAAWVDEVRLEDYSGRPPEFIEPPSSQTVGEGYPVTMRSLVVGQKPFTNYWISASVTNYSAGWQSSEVYSGFFAATPANAGTWRLVVSNQFGGITSPNFTLTVTSTPPHSLYVTDSYNLGPALTLSSNAPLTLTVSAEGTPPLTYRWQREGTNLPGANATVLNLAPFSTVKGGVYMCIVSNAHGHTTSAPVTLTFSTARPTVLAQPQALTLAPGQDLSLWADVEGPLPLTYQWFKDGFPVTESIAFENAIYRSPALISDTGYYQLRITNGNGATWSDEVLVTVAGAVPLGNAADTLGQPWQGENACDPTQAGWFGQTAVSHDGQDALATTPLPADGYCEWTLLTRVTGAGSVDFWWKLAGGGIDELAVEVLDGASNVLDSVIRTAAEGPAWAATNVNFSNSAALVRWTLRSLEATDSILCQAWLDEVRILSGSPGLTEALDDPTLNWSTASQNAVSGNPADGWFAQTNVTADGIDAVQSPPLQAHGRSWLQTVLTGPAVLQVNLNLLGDPDAVLQFTLDGTRAPFGRLFGDSGPPSIPYTSFFVIPPRSRIARWELDAGLQATTNARAWLDNVRLYTDVTAIPGQQNLARAMDNFNYAWLAYLWTEDANPRYANGTAARTPPIPNFSGAPLDSTVVGPAEIRFDCWVDSQTGDYLRFYIDDVEKTNFTGFTGKKTVRAAVPPGIHFLRWLYEKDGSGSAGADAAWIDNVVVAPLTNRTPVATNDVVIRFTDQVILSVTNLVLRNDADPDWFSVIRLQSHGGASTNGGMVTLQGDWLTYTPVSGFNGRDEFDYTITDDWGGFASAKVIIQPENPRQIPALNNVIILSQPGTVPAVRFRGTPGVSYDLQSSPTGLPGSWTTFATKTAAPDGTLDALEPAAAGQPQRFYRTVRQ